MWITGKDVLIHKKNIIKETKRQKVLKEMLLKKGIIKKKYKQFFEKKEIRHDIKRIQSKPQQIGSSNFNKISLSCFKGALMQI